MYMYYYSACLDFISVCNEKQRVRKCHRIPSNRLNLIDLTLACEKGHVLPSKKGRQHAFDLTATLEQLDDFL